MNLQKIQVSSDSKFIEQCYNSDERFCLWKMDAKAFLEEAPKDLKFKLIVTSPPYNIGKSYEKIKPIESYLSEQ